MAWRNKTWVIVAGVVAGLLVVSVFDPASHGFFPKCPFFWLTGFHCPGCGTLRALHQAMHGNFALALSYNPLAAVALPIVGVELIRDGLSFRRHGHVVHRHWPRGAIVAAAVVVVTFWILRNIPAAPFDLLAPPF